MIQISPTTISIPLSEEQIIDTNVFEIESDKKNKIEIKVLKSNINIILEGKQKNSLESTFYCSKQSINEIKNNKYFLMFDNLDEIYEDNDNKLLKGGSDYDNFSNGKIESYFDHGPTSSGINRGFRCVYPVK